MNNESLHYDALLRAAQALRRGTRFSEEPVDEIALSQILEAARWGLSQENTQPWQLVVVRDKKMRRALCSAYLEHDLDYAFWMEQQREFDLRAHSLRVPGEPEKALAQLREQQCWAQAPVLIALLGDGREHWGTPVGNMTFSFRKNQFTDALTSAAMLLRLSAASLGLATEWIDVRIQGPYKRLLNVPDIYFLHSFIAVGHQAQAGADEPRKPLQEFVHYETFDRGRMPSNEEVIRKLN